jgi:hypothetical protein
MAVAIRVAGDASRPTIIPLLDGPALNAACCVSACKIRTPIGSMQLKAGWSLGPDTGKRRW